MPDDSSIFRVNARSVEWSHPSPTPTSPISLGSFLATTCPYVSQPWSSRIAEKALAVLQKTGRSSSRKFLPPQCLKKTRPSSFLKYTRCVRYYRGSTADKKVEKKNIYIDVISLLQILYTKDKKKSNVFHPAINGRTGEAARLASLLSRDVILAARQDVRHSIIKTATALRSQVRKKITFTKTHS